MKSNNLTLSLAAGLLFPFGGPSVPDRRLPKVREPFTLRAIMTTEQLQAESRRVLVAAVPQYMNSPRRKGDRPTQETRFIKQRGKFTMNGTCLRSAFPVA